MIVWHIAPRDVISESLKSATVKTVDYVWSFFRECILHHIADLGYTQQLIAALGISARNVNCQDRFIGPPDCILHRIADLGYTQQLREALRISAGNVNRQDRVGNTPLHWLLRADHSYRDHTDATRYLLTYGGNAKLKNEDGQTPADMYVHNTCRKYDSRNRKEQKEMLMRLLQTGMVPMEILARGHEAMEAFNDALAEGEAEVNQGRTVFMGLERVGKTSTIKSFLRNT
ncbi:uncharacterized protein LOC117100061 [Anneissia japonica]|uniref:uncharacterized protein LOC117100061 n=1 Tax=Anneissia japonica TaxID=1529436 RepID=UPI0014257425|nr:uncharacterized protein LOC117100061 [Anneissia japonica]